MWHLVTKILTLLCVIALCSCDSRLVETVPDQENEDSVETVPDQENEDSVETVPDQENEDSYIELLATGGYTLSPDGLHIAIRNKDTLEIRDTKTGDIVRKVILPEHKGSRSPYEINNELTYFHMGVALYDIRATTAIKIASVKESSILSADGLILIERSVRDLIVHSGLITINLSTPDNIVNSFGYCHDRRAVVFVQHLDRIVIWGIDEDREIASIPAPDAATSRYHLSDDGKTLWTTGPGDSTDYFDIMTEKKITTVRNPVQLSDGSTLPLGLPISQHYTQHVTITDTACVIRVINIKDRSVRTKVVPVPCGPIVHMSESERTLVAYLSTTCVGYDPAPRVRIWRFW